MSRLLRLIKLANIRSPLIIGSVALITANQYVFAEGKEFRKLIYDSKITNINNVTDLVKLGKNITVPKTKTDEMLQKLVEPLSELDSMVGLHDIKSKIIDQILYALNELHIFPDNSTKREMMNTIIYGGAGVGKTELAKKLAKIYHCAGLVPTDKIIIGNRTDVIGRHVGETAHLTRAFLEKGKGGVIFIDEIYSLGDTGSQGYAKECIDQINLFLGDNKDTIIIVSGYKEDIIKHFLSINQGLTRRFPFRYEIEGYSKDELTEILLQKLIEDDFTYEDIVKKDLSWFFNKYKNSFPYYAGDVEAFVFKIKLSHSKRITFDPDLKSRHITWDDILKGFDSYQTDRKKIQ
jgi:SpoVK/Ycf46/Vps4 family AAA+-type ATPase